MDRKSNGDSSWPLAASYGVSIEPIPGQQQDQFFRDMLEVSLLARMCEVCADTDVSTILGHSTLAMENALDVDDPEKTGPEFWEGVSWALLYALMLSQRPEVVGYVWVLEKRERPGVEFIEAWRRDLDTRLERWESRC